MIFFLFFLFASPLYAAEAPQSTEVLELQRINIDLRLQALERDIVVQQYKILQEQKRGLDDEIAKRKTAQEKTKK